MLSRIADSLFWLNRYIERSDSLVRLVYVHYILSMDRSADSNNSWRPVLELCTATSSDEIEKIENDAPAVLKKILVDESNPNSIRCLVNRARENARGAQDHITKEVWEVVNQMYHLANQPGLSSKLNTDQAVKVIETFERSTITFTGVTDNTMWRGLGWNFLQLGKFVERCLQTVAITAKQLEFTSTHPAEVTDILQWRYLLLCLSGYELHLKTYRSADHTSSVLHQILLDENSTRSIIYSLIRISHYLENIMLIHEEQNKDLQRSMGKLVSKIKYLDIQTLDAEGLQHLLKEINTDLLVLSNKVGQYFFSYS